MAALLWKNPEGDEGLVKLYHKIESKLIVLFYQSLVTATNKHSYTTNKL